MTGAEAGSGPPLVLLHGLGGTWEYWARDDGAAGGARPLHRARPARLRRLRRPAGRVHARLGASTAGAGPARARRRARPRSAATRSAARSRCGSRCATPSRSRLVLVGPSGLKPAPPWQNRALKLVPVYRLLRRAPFHWEHWLLRVAPAAPRRPARARRRPLDRRRRHRAHARRRRARGARAAGRDRRVVRDRPRERGARASAVPVAAIWGDRDRMVPPGDAAICWRRSRRDRPFPAGLRPPPDGRAARGVRGAARRLDRRLSSRRCASRRRRTSTP